MRKSVILITVVAASRLARVVLGFGDGTGLLDVAFSAADAPNSPSDWPTLGGSAGAGSSPPSDSEPGDESGEESGDESGEESGDESGDEQGDESGDESGDGEPPEGHESWLDFFDWVTWTSAKNALPRGMGLPIDVLELGAPLGETLGEVKKNHQRKRDLLTTDHKGESHLRSSGDE